MISQRVQNMSQSGIRKYFKLASQIENCIDLSIGQPHYPVMESLRKLAIDNIESGNNRYTQTLGIESGREAIRNKYSLNSDFDVIITSGVSGALVLLYSLLLDPGDEILIPDPYFVGYKELAKHLNAVPKLVDTYPDFKITPERLEPHLTARTKALILSSPSNPTGVSLSKAEISFIQEFCNKHSIALIFDEIYEEFTYSESHHRPTMGSNVFITNGLSKSHSMLGWRLGWIVAPSQYLLELEKLQQTSFVCAPTPFQHIIEAALKTPPITQREGYLKRRNYLIDELSSKYEFVHPDGAIYFFPSIPSKFQNDTDFMGYLLEKKLLVIPGSVFSDRSTHFRISYGVSDDNFQKAVDILKSI